MADLKSLYKSLGFENVETYIQTGNVIFTSSKTHKNDIKTMIEKAIHQKYTFHVPVQIRTRNEIEHLINHCPFGTVNINQKGTKVLVTFLSKSPSKKAISDIQKHIIQPEKCVIKEDLIYLCCPNGHGKSKLSNHFFESKLNVNATTRNWKSVYALYHLLIRT